MVNVKKIIVTGSSSGIGNSITKELIKKKIKVIGISRNNNKSLIKRIRGKESPRAMKT